MRRALPCAGALFLAACAGVRGPQVGDGDGTRIILIRLWMDPYGLTRELDRFLGAQKPRPVIDLRQRVHDLDAPKAGWEALEPWEQQLWRDYAARGHGRVDSKRTNFHVTADDRLLMALDLSLDFMGPGAREEGQRLVRDPAFVGGIVVGAGMYLGLWMFPEPVFTKGIASIVTAALLLQFSVQEIQELAWAWDALDKAVMHARTIEEVELAASAFGRSIGARGLHILMIIAGKLAGKALEGLPNAAGSAGPPMAAAGTGLVLAEGQEIWILQSGMIALAGPGAIAVAMSAGGEVDLQKHEEAGGHSLDRHVGKTEAELRARLAAQPRLDEVSTFLSRAEAESAISATVRNHANKVTTWLEEGAKTSLRLEAPFKGGLVLRRGAAASVSATGVRVVLKGNGAGGWYVLTAYPLP